MAQTLVNAPNVVGPNIGEDFGAQFGHGLAAGDFDGDGKREVAMSTYEEENASFPDNEERGHVYVFEYDSGWSSGIEVLYPGGSETEVFFGYAMTAGDVDGDGKDELVVAAPGGAGAGALENGAVYIFDYDASGEPTFVLKYKFRSDPGNGGQQGDNFGWGIALGDFNGDGDLDLLVGARYWSECENCVYTSQCEALEDWTGAAYIFDHDGWTNASSGWNEVTSADLVIHGEASWSPVLNPYGDQTRGYFGARVACVGDVNDDGYDDFIVTASRRTPDGFGTCETVFDYYVPATPTCVLVDTITLSNDCRVGKVYLFAGGPTWSTGAQDAATYAKVIFEGEAAEDKFGQGLASGGDLNGDGVNDIVISSILHTETAQPAVGRVYVFLLPDYSSGWPSSNDKEWTADLANIIIDGPTGDSIVNFGFAMACNGNTDKETDSRADLIVGAPRGKSCDYTPDSLEENRGFAYLYRYTGSMSVGKNGGHLTWAAESDAAAFYRIDCGGTYNKSAPQLGRSIAFIGDADGATNSNDEFIIGCPGWDVATYPAKDDRGGIYMIAH